MPRCTRTVAAHTPGPRPARRAFGARGDAPYPFRFGVALACADVHSGTTVSAPIGAPAGLGRLQKLQTRPPHLLRPWQPWLAELAFDVAQYLATSAGLLAPLFGDQDAKNSQSDAFPEGVGGLARRGDYARLLMSEWLIAEEMPEEFLRRAAMREQLFLAPESEVAKTSPRLLVLFDTGPMQLGAPRLAHLCWWIALSRRAAQNKAQFSWASAQQPGTILSLNEPTALTELLHLRTVECVSVTHLQDWAQHLAGNDYDEMWWIGANVTLFDVFASDAALNPRQRALLQRFNCVCITEPLSLTERHLKVSRGKLTVTLALPEPKLAARLLRDPLSHSRTSAATPISGASPATGIAVSSVPGVLFGLQQVPIFSDESSHIAIARLDASPVVFELPKRATAHLVKGRQPNCFGDILAATLQRGRFGCITHHAGHWYFSDFGGPKKSRPQISIRSASVAELSLPLGTSTWQCALDCNDGWVYVLDRAHRLYGFHLDTLGKFSEALFASANKTGFSPAQAPEQIQCGVLIASNVLRLMRDQRCAIIVLRQFDSMVCTQVLDGKLHGKPFNFSSVAPNAQVFQPVEWLNQRGGALLTVNSQTFTLHYIAGAQPQTSTLRISSAHTALGLVVPAVDSHSAPLLAYHVGNAFGFYDFTAAPNDQCIAPSINAFGEIACACVSPDGQVIAWITHGRDLYVYSLKFKAYILHAKGLGKTS